MNKPALQVASRKVTKVSFLILGSIFAMVFVCFVIASVYQATGGNASLSEVSRNIGLPEDSGAVNLERTPISSLTWQEIQAQYRELNDDQWKVYAQNLLGDHVSWSGKVSSIENQRIEIDMGTAPLQYVILLGVSNNEKSLIEVGDTINFEGRLWGFHLNKGMTPVVDSAQVK